LLWWLGERWHHAGVAPTKFKSGLANLCPRLPQAVVHTHHPKLQLRVAVMKPMDSSVGCHANYHFKSPFIHFSDNLGIPIITWFKQEPFLDLS
jgi:hypothetical protein